MVDAWQPSNEEEDLILSFALQNALEHGVAKPGSIMSRMSQFFDMSQVGRYLGTYVGQAVADANLIVTESPDNALELLMELNPELGERLQPQKKVRRIQELPELNNVEQGNFRVRFAPNPNGPLTIGHSRGVILNREYADLHDGEFYLRFDDTGMGTKDPTLEAYDMIPEDIEWLTGRKPDEIFFASDRLKIYYDFAYMLINNGDAYVDNTTREESAALKEAGIPLPGREQSIDDNLELFKMMVDNKFVAGEAVLRIKSDPNAPDPAMRDFVLFRMQDDIHPLQPDYRCWPVLEFQSAIDDYDLDITHIIRGVDLRASAPKQQLIYDSFGWDYPEVNYWGKVKIFDENDQELSFSTSQYAQEMKDGLYTGWDDPKLLTVRGLESRGYTPEAIKQWWLDMGMTERDINVSLSTLNSINSKFSAESFDSEEYDNPWTESDCVICDRPFGTLGIDLWVNNQNYTYLKDRYEQESKDYGPGLKSRKNPEGMPRTPRTIALVTINEYGLNALNEYMIPILLEEKKRSNIAEKVIGLLRDILVDPERILGDVVNIRSIGGRPSRGRDNSTGFDPRFQEQWEADGVSIDPPPGPVDDSKSCAICGREYIWSVIAQGLQSKFLQQIEEYDNDTLRSKDNPEGVPNIATNIAGDYLLDYREQALNKYFELNKKPVQKVINLLRIALVPMIMANTDIHNFLGKLEYEIEAELPFGKEFAEQWSAEEFDAEGSFAWKKVLKEKCERLNIPYEECLIIEIQRLRNRLEVRGFNPDAKIGEAKFAEENTSSYSAETVMTSIANAESLSEIYKLAENIPESTESSVYQDNLDYLSRLLVFDDHTESFMSELLPVSLQDVKIFAQSVIDGN